MERGQSQGDRLQMRSWWRRGLPLTYSVARWYGRPQADRQDCVRR